MLEQLIRCHTSISSASNLLNCVLTFENPVKNVQINIEPNHIEIQDTDTDLQIKFEFTEFLLQPETCRGLKYLPSGELHFNIKGRQLFGDGDNLSQTQHAMLPTCRGSTTDVVEKIQLLQNKWFCQSCHQKILSDGCIFSRVLPLPSENWSDYADMWFCHNHGDDSSRQQGKLLPKAKECFVGETYFLLDKEHVKIGAVKVMQDNAVMCRRCGKQLGVVIETENDVAGDQRVYKIFSHMVTMQFVEDLLQQTVCASGQTEGFFAHLLQEQSHIYTSFRFIIDAKNTTEHNKESSSSTCLVWLLDPNMTVYKSGPHDNYMSEMEKTREMKVLFKCQLQSAESHRCRDHVTASVISLWKKDNTVHGITLPHPVLLQLVSLLIRNCKSLPRSQRYLNGFHVSYIKHTKST